MIDLIYLVILSVIVSVIVGLLFKRKPDAKNIQLAKKLRESQQIFGDLSEQCGHSFHVVDMYNKPTYSSTSGQPLILGGLHCDKCGICVASDERKAANTYLKCKPLFIDDEDEGEQEAGSGASERGNDYDEAGDVGTTREHHWVVGNLPLLSVCAVCSQPAGHEPKLVDYCCSICHRTVHDKCLGVFLMPMATRFCDAGSLARFTIPPWSVRVRRSRAPATRLLKGKTTKKISISRICQPPLVSMSAWQPVFVFANCLSGNADAEAILHAFRLHLNPSCQVFDLSIHRDPTAILRMINNLLPDGVDSIIALAAGGDGTVRWIANSVCQVADAFASRNRTVQIAVLPLGTGNDLARAIGLGGGHVGSLEVVEYFNDTLSKCIPMQLDRWQVDIGSNDKATTPTDEKVAPAQSLELSSRNSSPTKNKTSGLSALKLWRPHLPAMMKTSVQTSYMYNYISIGADASVTLSFAQRRDSTPWLCGSRLVNKLIYGIYGLVDMLQRECHDLHQHLRLTLDDKEIEELPKFEALIFLNISSWAGGCRLLELGTDDDSSNHLGVSFTEQKFDDGVIEVLGVQGSMHMAQLMAGFGSPVRLGQAKRVQIELLKRFPVQVDGEAWKQSPSRITISCCGQVTVLSRSDSDD